MEGNFWKTGTSSNKSRHNTVLGSLVGAMFAGAGTERSRDRHHEREKDMAAHIHGIRMNEAKYGAQLRVAEANNAAANVANQAEDEHERRTETMNALLGHPDVTEGSVTADGSTTFKKAKSTKRTPKPPAS